MGVSRPRGLVAGVVSAKATDTQIRISRLSEALSSQGVTVVGELIQRRQVNRSPSQGGVKRLNSPLSSATILGKGKAAELARLVAEQQVDAVYFLNPLSRTQAERLAELVGCEVFGPPQTE